MKQSELLRKQADMIDLAEKHGIDDWHKLVQVNCFGTWYGINDNFLVEKWEYKFALGVVEGKPVFECDELYCKDGCKHKIMFVEDGNLMENSITGFTSGFLSWNPPKPKTILVELLVDDAEWLGNQWNGKMYIKQAQRVSGTVRKALESIKQS